MASEYLWQIQERHSIHLPSPYEVIQHTPVAQKVGSNHCNVLLVQFFTMKPHKTIALVWNWILNPAHDM